MVPPLAQPLLQFGNHVVSQPVPFRLHIGERARNKRRPGSPNGCSHDAFLAENSRLRSHRVCQEGRIA
jgi:hypothetical protein